MKIKGVTRKDSIRNERMRGVRHRKTGNKYREETIRMVQTYSKNAGRYTTKIDNSKKQKKRKTIKNMG